MLYKFLLPALNKYRILHPEPRRDDADMNPWMSL
jgi:hypothetical protein